MADASTMAATPPEIAASPVHSVLRHLQQVWTASPAGETFGRPLRLFHQSPAGALFPFILIVRSERVANGSDPAAVPAGEPRPPGETVTLTFNLWDRADQRARLDGGMEALIAALEGAHGPIEGQSGHLVLALPVLSDLFLAEDGRFVRGILRVRAVIER